VLTPQQSVIFIESALCIPRFGLDPMNTGNLQDLIDLTLHFGNRPLHERVLQAFVEFWADAFKTLSTPDDARLTPKLELWSDTGVEESFVTFGQLKAYFSPVDAMLVAHPSVAFGHPEVQAMARRLIRVTVPKDSAERWLNRMVLWTQHSPSSAFIRARQHAVVNGRHCLLIPDVALLAQSAGYDAHAAAIHQFHRNSAQFQTDWLASVEAGQEPTGGTYLAWRTTFRAAFAALPFEFQDSIWRDLLSSFQATTLRSGKWVRNLFHAERPDGRLTSPADVLHGIASVANQYCVDWVILGGTPQGFVERVSGPLETLGIHLENDRFAFNNGPIPSFIEAQFQDAGAR
jgi:hypothetical protein